MFLISWVRWLYTEQVNTIQYKIIQDNTCLCIMSYSDSTALGCESRTALTVPTWCFVCLHLWHLKPCLPSFSLLHRGAPLRRPALAVATLPCLRSTPHLPPTHRQVKVRQHLQADCHLWISALHMPVQSTLNIPSWECTRALSWTGRRLWHPVTR